MELSINTPTFKARVKSKGYAWAVVVERIHNNVPYRARRLCFGAIEALDYIIKMKGACNA